MITRIGLVAGDIWNHLEKREGKAQLDEMVKALGGDRDLVMMSIGWLAREGHIFLEGKGPNYTVILK